MAKYIKDLNKYLDKKTGMTADEREQWRNDINKITTEAFKEKDPQKAKELKQRAMNYFKNMSLWKSDKLAGKL